MSGAAFRSFATRSSSWAPDPPSNYRLKCKQVNRIYSNDSDGGRPSVPSDSDSILDGDQDFLRNCVKSDSSKTYEARAYLSMQDLLVRGRFNFDSVENPDLDRVFISKVSTSDPHLCYAVNEFMDELFCTTSRCYKSSVKDLTSGVYAKVDSASNVHLWSLKDARKFFHSPRGTRMRVIGVSKAAVPADCEGYLVVVLEDALGNQYEMHLGLAYAMKDLPVNLLSVSLLLKQNAVLHFEKSNCYFQPHRGGAKIPLIQENGMFQLPVSALMASSTVREEVSSYTVNGRCYGATADWATWHKRLAHRLDATKLHLILNQNLVDGFQVKGKAKMQCACDSCRQAKIRSRPSRRYRDSDDFASFIGHTVSVDTKTVPFTSFHGYKYCLVFVDHYSRLSLVYFMRSKDETTEKLRQYLAEMRRFGYDVRRICSDRGSEFFSQEGETHQDRDRRQHSFDDFCSKHEPKVLHTVTPVGSKEKLAELWFRDHFEAANVMLWEARLSPAFWPDAVAYSNFIANRMPNAHIGPSTPWTLLTGERARWDKLKVFGCDCYEHIPSNEFVKVPGIPRGRKLIFMGFEQTTNGWRVFDPETRRYFSTENVYFYESFQHRVDALRHHDKRRDLLKKGLEQPIVVDDFDMNHLANLDSVRNLYLDPDAPPPPNPAASEVPLAGSAANLEGASLEGVRESASKGADTPPDGSVDVDVESDSRPRGPLTEQAQRAARAKQVLSSGAMLRPLRLTRVGVPLKKTVEDKAWLQHAFANNVPTVWQRPCPKSKDSTSRKRYLKYMFAKSMREALELGATREDIEWDYLRGWIQFPKHESDLPGHIFIASEVAEDNGYTHILDDMGIYVKSTEEVDFMLAQAFTTMAATAERRSFNEELKTSFDLEPEKVLAVLTEHDKAIKFAEQQMAKVYNSEKIQIDWALAPEPTRFEDVQPEVCCEHDKWRLAMEEEIYCMARFGVHRPVAKSMAKGRQILGCRWVYKRKVNKFGIVERYRARLVAQGFRQKAYDSFDPDETYSPVVHKDSLRLFLSICAAQNLRIYQADVKAAFLQAPLSEKIYMKAPPGFASFTDQGEEEIWELNHAIYGLKQSSSSFWTALNAHLVSKGYKSLLGDPCLFRKVLPDGRVIICCTYVDDLLCGVQDQASVDLFLSELRERFVIEEGEGKPVDWLLGMAVSQDIAAGTVRISMELAITKLAEGILTPQELEKAKGVHYPMLKTPLKVQKERTVSVKEFDFLSVVGSLLHIANCVRCDIALAVGILARHAATPGLAHVRAAKRVVMYLYNTRQFGITYSRSADPKISSPMMYERAKHPLDDGTNHLQTFTDSDYAGDESRRSTMGMVCMLNGGPIAWFSTLGKTIATSTCEAEVNAACSAAKEALHLSRLLFDIGGTNEMKPIPIAEDNAACIAQANSGLRSIRKAKHYEVKLRFLQQLVVDEAVEFKYCPTHEMLADLFTKPLEAEQFVYLRNRILS
jgi:hypothetical protein